MEKQQTAIEWLENEFQEMCKDFGGLHSDFIVKFNQAKAMEKEQKIEFAFDFYYDFSNQSGVPFNLISENRTNAEQYYNETFKSE